MLIPDFRGDVLSLLTDLYSLLDVMGSNFQELIIEHDDEVTETEELISEGRKNFLNLVKVVVQSVDKVIVAARTFFRNPQTVKDHIYQVRVYESKADTIAITLKKAIFAADLPKFSQKINLRDTVDALSAIAGKAEEVADELSIYAIQRSL